MRNGLVSQQEFMELPLRSSLPSQQNAGYKLVQLANGTCAVYAAAYNEKMHPGLGPAAEAEALYVRQLKIRERLAGRGGEFVVWDIGLGAAANALTLLRLTRDLPCPLHVVSFDDTGGPLEFALQNAEVLGYLRGYEAAARTILASGRSQFIDGVRAVNWQFHLGDFPAWLAQAVERRAPTQRESWSSCFSVPPEDKLKLELHHAEPESGTPHAIFFDAFSPAKNPAMWTLPVFTNLFRLLDPRRPCALTTYSRSTMIRATLLMAGFFVGRGVATGRKEETTVAANTLALLDEPLDRNWLERAHRSGSAEPLLGAGYRQARLSAATWDQLQAHPQFR